MIPSSKKRAQFDNDHQEKSGHKRQREEESTTATTTTTALPRTAFIKIASGTATQLWQVESTKRLLDEQCSIPFIARYRKEQTGGACFLTIPSCQGDASVNKGSSLFIVYHQSGLDEKQLRSIQSGLAQADRLQQRKQSVITTLRNQGKLTATLADKIGRAENIHQVEDLYLPYKTSR